MVDSSTLGSKSLRSSSRTKTTPARGAPKAAARPAPAPADISMRSSDFRRPESLEKPLPTIPPSWMLGPSRPRARPEPMAMIPPKNLSSSTLSQSVLILPMSSPFIWGIPEPEIYGSLYTKYDTRKAKTPRMINPIHLWPSRPVRKVPSSGSARPTMMFLRMSIRLRMNLKADITTPTRRPTIMPSRITRYFKLPRALKAPGMLFSFILLSLRDL